MNTSKSKILKNICYTELVYDRINKKLGVGFSKGEIEGLVLMVVEQTEERFISRVGKNYYVTNVENNIRITINSNTFRVITVDRL